MLALPPSTRCLSFSNAALLLVPAQAVSTELTQSHHCQIDSNFNTVGFVVGAKAAAVNVSRQADDGAQVLPAFWCFAAAHRAVSYCLTVTSQRSSFF